MTASIKTTAIFLRPFQFPSFDETLPPGEYEIETQLLERVDWREPGTRAPSVILRLHSRASHPGLDRTLTVPLAELEHALAKDKLTGKPLMDFFVEEMLADPMIRLVMQADGVDESELRNLYSPPPQARPKRAQETRVAAESSKVEATGASGPRAGGGRPGIGE